MNKTGLRNIPSSIRAVIFDMDGLLLDTERIALSTFLATCREFGFEPDIDTYVRCIGTTADRTRQILLEGYGTEFPYDRIREKWEVRYENTIAVHSAARKPGASALLEWLDGADIRVGMATSTRRKPAIRKLKQSGLLPYFSIIVCGDEVTRGKPDPEPYLTAADKLKTPPHCCLALEDSDNGVLSALRAGLHAIQIPDLKPPSQDIIDLGHPILPSLKEVRELLASIRR